MIAAELKTISEGVEVSRMAKISSTTLLVIATTILKVAVVALLSALMISFVFIFINDSCGND
jgi:hypothetical protein